MPDAQDPERCPYCGRPWQLVWVHGHGQCAHCGNNIEPCCQGDETLPRPPEDQDEDDPD